MKTDMYYHLTYETNKNALQQEMNSVFNKSECHLECIYIYMGQKQILTLCLKCPKTTSRWYVDLNRKSKIIALLEENIEHL